MISWRSKAALGLQATFHMNRLSVIVLSLAALVPSQALAHARLLSPAPRTSNGTNPDGLKSAPCGGLAKSTQLTKLTADSNVDVVFEETISHKGYFRILLSTQPDPTKNSDFTVLKDNIRPHEAGTALGRISETVKLPAAKCPNCVLQLIQVMQDAGVTSNYYACADIEIGAQSIGTADAGATPPLVSDASVSQGDADVHHMPSIDDEGNAADDGGCTVSHPSNSTSSIIWNLSGIGCLSLYLSLRRWRTRKHHRRTFKD